jgi:hypothetical protein
MQAHLVKPLDPEKLMALVQQVGSELALSEA